MKLHLGCGKNVKDGYINIDKYVEYSGVSNYDIFNLPFEDSQADEILTEHLVEHIPFADEEKFWRECHRVLKTGGKMTTETPDMEWLCRQFLKAEDDFKAFYHVGSKDHYFGNGTTIEQRWGMITTHFFGNQNGPGQFHYNGYTDKKLRSIAMMLEFSSCEIKTIFNKGAQAIVATMIK